MLKIKPLCHILLFYQLNLVVIFVPLKLRESDTIRRYGFVGVEMASLKEMILRAGFKGVHARVTSQCVSPLPVAAYQDSQHHICPNATNAPPHCDNRMSLCNCK